MTMGSPRTTSKAIQRVNVVKAIFRLARPAFFRFGMLVNYKWQNLKIIQMENVAILNLGRSGNDVNDNLKE